MNELPTKLTGTISYRERIALTPTRRATAVAGPGGARCVRFIVIRESSEGEYVDNGGRFKIGRPEEFATQTALHTRLGIERPISNRNGGFGYL